MVGNLYFAVRQKKGGKVDKSQTMWIDIYYIDTDEIPGFFLLLKNHIFIARSEDAIFIFHVCGIGVTMVTT